MPKISVIVPVYNVEEYLDICLDTILLQTFKDFEAICINDGSSDNSLKILEHYQKFDDRIKIISTENKGLSHARNTGLKIAKGKYTVFIDSDDYISQNCLEKMNDNLDRTNADFLYSNIIQIEQNSRKIRIWDFLNKDLFYKSAKKDYFTESSMDERVYFGLHTTAYAKMYSYEFIEKFHFEEGIIFEDIPYFANCYLNAKKISYDFTPYYYYRIKRKGSILNNSSNVIDDLLRAQNLRRDIFKKQKKYEKYKENLFLNDTANILYRFLTIEENFRKKAFLDIQKEYENYNFKELEKIKNNKLLILFQNLRYTDEKEFEKFALYNAKAGQNG